MLSPLWHFCICIERRDRTRQHFIYHIALTLWLLILKITMRPHTPGRQDFCFLSSLLWPWCPEEWLAHAKCQYVSIEWMNPENMHKIKLYCNIILLDISRIKKQKESSSYYREVDTSTPTHTHTHTYSLSDTLWLKKHMLKPKFKW